MGLDLNDGLVQLKITESVCGFVAICMTVTRIWIRRDRYWWDDAWAFFSLLNLFVQFASVFMHVDNPEVLSKTNRVAAYYLMAVTFYTVIWSARLSILFSIIRIDPDPVWNRRLKYVAALFIGAILFFLAQLLWVCEPQSGWKNLPSPQCRLNKEVAICQLVSDIIADLLLITLPLRLIRGIKDRPLRRRLFFIFSTSIVTTIVSLVHAAYIITTGGMNVLISALVEDCMSLTVANVPVVATALIRNLASGKHERDQAALSDESPDGPRWTSFRFRTNPTQQGGGTSRWGISTFGRGVKPVNVTTVPTTTTTDSSTMTELDTKNAAAHYIGIGSLRQPDDAMGPGTMGTGTDVDVETGRTPPPPPTPRKQGEGEHYISVGSVRYDNQESSRW